MGKPPRRDDAVNSVNTLNNRARRKGEDVMVRGIQKLELQFQCDPNRCLPKVRLRITSEVPYELFRELIVNTRKEFRMVKYPPSRLGTYRIEELERI